MPDTLALRHTDRAHGMPLGEVGVGWRPSVAGLLTELAASGRLRFSEVVAENVDPTVVPDELASLVRSGVTVVPHGVTLGLAGAEVPSRARLQRLAQLADVLGAPLVSEHVAFVRAGQDAADLHGDVLEAGHLVPPPRTRQSVDVLVDNVIRAQDELDVPLALENVAATLRWPEDTLDEPDFLTELVERTGCLLVLDVANLHATCQPTGADAHALLRRMPLHHVAYVHVAGGVVRDGIYHDSHAHPIVAEVVALLTDLVGLLGPAHPPVLLERDSDVTPRTVSAELDVVRRAVGGTTA